MCEPKAQYFKTNNWIFTQYIQRPQQEYDVTIYVNVTVRLTTPCGPPNCPRFLLVYKYIANMQQNISVFTNASSYLLVGNISSLTMNAFPVTASLNFTLKSGDVGFYLGIRDTGSCTYLNRVLVYNYQCPKKQTGLVNLPLSAAPTSKESPLIIPASCVSGSVNTTSLDYRCSSNGNWSGIATCICRTWDGYKYVRESERCDGCGVGFWLDNDVCRKCPENTVQTLPVTPICPCSPGYFRAFGKLPSDSCTGEYISVPFAVHTPFSGL